MTRNVQETLKLGELFAGYGGLGMAVEEVFGAETAWFSEFEEAPSKILAHRWPGVPNYGDVTKIDWASVEPVDIISGGSPCQDLSLAGKRKGMTEGTRSNLWESMREGIATIRPRYVVWENVRGALSAKAVSEMEQSSGRVGEVRGSSLRALGRVLGDLADLGYDCQWRGLRAADVGAPHGRYRIFVLAADRNNSGWGEQWRALPVQAEHPAAKHSSPYASYACNDGRERHEKSHSESQANGEASEPWGHADGCGVDSERVETWGHPSAVGEINWGDYESAIRRWEARLGRPAPRPTEPTGRNGGHRLSPWFTEWMMGLPEGWVTDPAIGLRRNEQLKACGNGVVPQQAIAALGDMLRTFHSQKEVA